MKHKNHYDALPVACFQGSILDVGCGDGTNQRASKNWPHIDTAIGDGRYHGLDVNLDPFVDINGDIMGFNALEPYDFVLAIHVIEHIEEDEWPHLFDRLKAALKPNGLLVIGCPHMQSPNAYKHFKGPENQRHVTFRIDAEKISQYLGGKVGFQTYRGPYSQSLICFWRNKA